MAAAAAGPRRHRARRDRAPRRLRVRHRRRRLLRRVLDGRRRGRGGRRVAARSCAPTTPSRSRCGWRCTPARRSSATATTSAPRSNRAARLMALAHGGQILVSDTTEVLLRSRVVAAAARRARAARAARADRGVPGRRRRAPVGVPGAAQRRRTSPATCRGSVSSLVGRDDAGRRRRRAGAVATGSSR